MARQQTQRVLAQPTLPGAVVQRSGVQVHGQADSEGPAGLGRVASRHGQDVHGVEELVALAWRRFEGADETRHTAIAFLGITDWRFVAPIFFEPA